MPWLNYAVSVDKLDTNVTVAMADGTAGLVGVLLAVLGYGLGTYGAYICGLILQQVAP